MSDDPLDQEERSARLRQRLWGAAVLVALLVIVLPLVLDGSGSESQFRRVERLREEPPRVIDANGQLETPVARSAQGPADAPEATVTETPSAPPAIHVGEEAPPNYYGSASDTDVSAARSSEPLTAWVVQAGSFGDQGNAMAVRDQLRRAGFPSFVSAAEDGRSLYRVRVGPMIDAYRAEATRDAVVALLGRDAIVVKYP